MKEGYAGPEKREFLRLDYTVPLSYKVCKRQTISKLLEGYTADISSNGLLCNIKDRVKKDDILWLCFDRATLSICSDLEKRALIYQGGIIAKVVRIEAKDDDGYNVGVQFITREEINMTHVYPKIHFFEGTKNEE